MKFQGPGTLRLMHPRGRATEIKEFRGEILVGDQRIELREPQAGTPTTTYRVYNFPQRLCLVEWD